MNYRIFAFKISVVKVQIFPDKNHNNLLSIKRHVNRVLLAKNGMPFSKNTEENHYNALQ